MENVYDSEYGNVRYIEEDNVVLLTWKKFCSFENYRKHTMFASEQLKRYTGSNFVVDARNGFEDEKEDVEWGFTVLIPDMAKSSCKKCIFIMEEITELDGEIDLWSNEFRKYFEVSKVKSYDDAIDIIKNK